MADDDDRPLVLVGEAPEQSGQVATTGGVEVGGRFVGEQDGRVIGQRSSDRHPLLLAAGHLGGARGGPVGEADPFEELTCPSSGGGTA